MKTPYSTKNAEFSQIAHNAARQQIYPRLFGPNNTLEYESPDLHETEFNRFMDTQMGIDKIVNVTVTGQFKYPIKFTVQERFRKQQYADFEDITITEYNPLSGLPSELYKLQAMFFVYGYFDGINFSKAIYFYPARLLHGLTLGAIQYTKEQNTRSMQHFICVTFGEIEKLKIGQRII